ncbi:MAG: hypothetical protein ABIW47_18440 [Ginsengibacter sp.]
MKRLINTVKDPCALAAFFHGYVKEKASKAVSLNGCVIIDYTECK